MLNKILFISNFRTKNDGWGEACRGLALAMDKVGLDVVCRSINVGKPEYELCPTMENLLKKESFNSNICIQHLLPPWMEYSSDFKQNIGSFASESRNYQYTEYVPRLNYMDSLWVPCRSNLRDAMDSGVKRPISVVPHAFDLEKYKRDYQKIPIPAGNGDFMFYTIAEGIKRKNLTATIKAFHSEFSPNEPVQLVIKSRRPNSNDGESLQYLQDLCNMTKVNLKLYRNINHYKQEILISKLMTDEEIAGLHKGCDCFVSSSYGEGFNIPLWESLAFGNKAISSDNGGPQDYITHKKNGFLVTGKHVPAFGLVEGLPDLYSAREEIFEVNIKDLQNGMRWAYENRDNKIKTDMSKFSYESVGSLIKEKINEYS